jgi:prevent-host-death family protein
MAKEITALELRNRFGAIMEEVRYRKEPYIVKRNGRPMIVLVDIEAYQASEAQRRL